MLVGVLIHCIGTACEACIAAGLASHVHTQALPIVRVAVEPRNPAHMAELRAGMRVLGRADPSVQVEVARSGEHLVVACI